MTFRHHSSALAAVQWTGCAADANREEIARREPEAGHSCKMADSTSPMGSDLVKTSDEVV
jgi:hypothetical protein